MPDDGRDYFQRRAEAELEQAQRATKPAVVKAHSDLANAYLERIASVIPDKQSQDA